MLWEGFGFGWAETAYSGVTFPLVEPALEKAAKLGFRRIVVFPYFLFTGILVQRIYDATDAVAARHPEIEFVKAPYLNDHPLVLETFVDRVHEILDGPEPDELPALQIPRADSRLRGGGRPAAGEPSPSCGGDLARRRALPPPLGEGGSEAAGWGRDAKASTPAAPHPSPPATPSPQGGGERAAPTVLHYKPTHSHGHDARSPSRP